MKTYKLKKGLPLAKAGEEVEIYEKWQNLVRIYKKPNNNRSGILICQIKKEDIDEWLEEIPQKPKSVFDLKFGDRYFTKDSYWATIERNWQNNYTENQLQKEGKIFLTKEECDKDYEKELAIQRIKKYCWENSIELADNDFIKDSNNAKFNIYYDIETTGFHATYFNICLWDNLFFFKTKEDTEKVIENCEDDLKIIFNI